MPDEILGVGSDEELEEGSTDKDRGEEVKKLTKELSKVQSKADKT